MKKVITSLALLITLSFLLVFSCRTAPVQEESTPEWFWNNNTCACDDMNCWNEKTNKGLKSSLKCAANAALLAAGLKFADTMKAVMNSSREITTAALNYDSDPAVLISTTIEETSKYSGTAQCSVAALSGVTSILKVVSSVVSISTSLSTTAFTEQIVENNTVGFFKNMSSLTKASFTSTYECLKFLGTAPTSKSMKFLSKITPSIKVIVEGILVPYVLIDCGLSLTKSSITLLTNSNCAISDFKKLSDSYEKLEQTRAAALKVQTCKNEPVNCNNGAMFRYGIRAHQDATKFRVSKGTLPKRCYNTCLDYEIRKSICKTYSKELYKDPEELAVCLKVCESDQCDSALSECLSQCCDQDYDCTVKARNMKSL